MCSAYPYFLQDYFSGVALHQVWQLKAVIGRITQLMSLLPEEAEWNVWSKI